MRVNWDRRRHDQASAPECLAAFFSALRALWAADCSAAFSFAPVYDSPTSCFPPVQPNTQTTRTSAKTQFQAVTMICWPSE